jgi:hypothetical protein
MEHQDLDRIRFITRYFLALQGFRETVPMGLTFLGTGGSILLLGVEGPLGYVLAIFSWIAGFGGAVLLRHRSPSYYRETVGEVERPRASSKSKLFYLWIVPGVLLLCAVFWITWTLGNYGPRFLCVVCGVLHLVTWIWRERRPSQAHYLLFGVFFLGLASVRPLLAFFEMTTQWALAQVVFGASSVAAGFLDHRFLVREMGQMAVDAAVEEQR